MAVGALTHLLDDLLAERRAALRTPLARNEAYMADLEAEIETCRRAVVFEEVVAQATARAAVAGKLHG